MPTIYKPKRKTNNESHNRQARIKIYNTSRWRALRKLKLMNCPLCEVCERKGVVTVADDVHHVVSFMSADDPDKRTFLAFDYDNLMSVCDSCHSRIHHANVKT